MHEFSRLELNALIERLIESAGEDQEARSAIVAVAVSLRPMKRMGLRATVDHRSDRTSGATPEHGNVEIATDQTEQKSVQFGQGTCERIGFYKLSRIAAKRFFLFQKEERILIHHYWKADRGTESDFEKPEAWCLGCTSTMEPVWFGRFRYTAFSLGWLFLTITEIQELWGPKPETLHSYGVEVALKTY
jgi:hypothetical protein